MMNQVYTLVFGFALLVLLGACAEQEALQEGDLLFQDLDCGSLCDAIETVTEGVDGKDFSHCGMVVRVEDELMVLEAIGESVQFNSLETFFARSGDTLVNNNITVGRLKEVYQPLLQKAYQEAQDYVGKGYDSEFVINNDQWYCSELLYDIFKEANGGEVFFELAPMTFKDPATNAFFPAWIDYYEGLGTAIPEGKPGTNPGLISRSDKIDIIEIPNLSF